MIVVSDTMSLRCLAVLDFLDLLPQRLFDHVHCPNAVLSGCLSSDAPSALRQWAVRPPSWLVADTVTAVDRDLSRLDEGESATIALAKHWHADAILMDELMGGRFAAGIGSTVAGTLHIAAQAVRRGWLDCPSTTRRLRRETNFRVTDAMIAAVWDETGKF